VSIARRLQDPLAELVKIEPKSIGVGQYQHDVSQAELARTLDAVVEDCVNAVGADVNTASAPLLARIAGLNTRLAANIVSHRDANGAFRSRAQLRDRLGDKTFEQAPASCASWAATILDGRRCTQSLPAGRAHQPSRRARRSDGNAPLKLQPASTPTRFGLPTVQDILKELEKPGRDPRPEFKTASFKDGVEDVKDLQPGMLLEGVVTNVANFGAFVDIGVHQDGLVHISALSSKFVKDPREVVKAGDIVTVTVVEVDAARKRIGLTMRTGDPPRARCRSSSAAGARGDRARRSRRAMAVACAVAAAPTGTRRAGAGTAWARPTGANGDANRQSSHPERRPTPRCRRRSQLLKPQ
jgi:uncharacterized protein